LLFIQYFKQLLLLQDTENLCVLPIVDGVIYSEKGSTNILTPGSLISEYRTVIENCEEGFHKAYSNSVKVCQGNGKWFPNSEKLCFSKLCIVICVLYLSLI